MKKIICSILVFLLCVTLVGCNNGFFSSVRTQSDETKEEAKTEVFDTPIAFGATITDKIGANTLVAQIFTYKYVKGLGDTVYIVSYRADQFCVGDSVKNNTAIFR